MFKYHRKLFYEQKKQNDGHADGQTDKNKIKLDSAFI